jgi:membrane protein
MNKLKTIGFLFKDTFTAWQNDNASRLAAALAYYTIFSMAPLLMITVIFVGLFYGESTAQDEIVAQIKDVAGSEVAEVAQGIIANVAKPDSLNFASLVTIVLTLYGASNLFYQLQDTLNTIWHVTPQPMSVFNWIKQRVNLFIMVFVVGLLLILSLFANIAVSAITTAFDLPGSVQIGSNFVAFGVTIVLFALIYKVLPDIEIAWGDVWIGSVVTSLLFTLEQYLISLYFGIASVGSAYGAAGSLIVLLLWVYYSAQIFLFGAEFTRVYTYKFGSKKGAQ